MYTNTHTQKTSVCIRTRVYKCLRVYLYVNKLGLRNLPYCKTFNLVDWKSVSIHTISFMS